MDHGLFALSPLVLKVRSLSKRNIEDRGPYWFLTMSSIELKLS